MKKMKMIGFILLCCVGLMACGKKIETSPDIKDSVLTRLGNYKGITYLPAETDITDEEVEAAIKDYLESQSIDELTDEKAIELGYQNAEELKISIESDLSESKIQNAKASEEASILDQFLNACEYDISEKDIDHFTNYTLDMYKEAAKTYEMDYKTFVTDYVGMTEEEFESSVRDDSEYIIQYQLALNGILKEENVKLEDKYEKYAQDLAESQGFNTITELEELYGKKEVEKQVCCNIALDILLEHAIAIDEK